MQGLSVALHRLAPGGGEGAPWAAAVSMSAEGRRLAGAGHYADEPLGPPRTGLLTDHYELTMVRAALASGAAGRRAVFEIFAGRLPARRRYGVVAGTGPVLRALEAFRFSSGHLEYLSGAR